MTEIKKTIRDSAGARWGILLLISGLMFATYWFQDMFSGIKGLFESQLGFSSEDFGIVISATTWANCLGMIVVGGIVLDRWGIRLAGILFGTLALLGAALTALGAGDLLTQTSSEKLTIMIIGRILFGVGLEITCVIVSRTVVKWFKGKELALAMGINVGLARIGTMLATMLSIDIGGGEVSPAINFGATLVGIGLLMYFVYFIFDIKLDHQLIEQDEEKEEFRIGDLLQLGKNTSFIWITLLCMTFYSAVFPFYQYVADLLVNKFGFSSHMPELSNVALGEKISAFFNNGPKVAGLIPLSTIIFTPIFGFLVDRKGKAASLMMIGSMLLIFTHISLSLFHNLALGYAGLISLGIAFSLVPAAMWPSVAKIVPESRLGTAYATMFTVQNWGLALFYWLIGAALDWANQDNLESIKSGDSSYDYTIPVLMLAGLGVLSIGLAFLLKRSDKKQGFGLETPKK